MKFNTSIFFLLAIAHFSIFVSCADDDDDDIEEERNFNTDRWRLEFEKFRPGLYMENEKGELVELTLEIGNSSSDQGRANGGLTIEEAVQFFLYTKLNPQTPQRLETTETSIRNSNYNASKPTFFITHGYVNSKNSEACTLIRDAYLKFRDGNVIVVDWSARAAGFYVHAANDVVEAGKVVARMIKFLQRTGFLSFDRTTLVGHSLGAHLMGIAGYYTRGQVLHVVGLDPAWPLFFFTSPGKGISDKDAQYVEIVHTNAARLGSPESRGHTDYFVNGGVFQPGCVPSDNSICAHSRVYHIFAESIGSSTPFFALECGGFLGVLINFFTDACVGPKIARLGVIKLNPADHGIFHLPTNEESPYAINDPIRNYLARRHRSRLPPVQKLGPNSQ